MQNVSSLNKKKKKKNCRNNGSKHVNKNSTTRKCILKKRPRYVNHRGTEALLRAMKIMVGPVLGASHYLLCGPGSVVGIATGYGLDGLGIEFR